MASSPSRSVVLASLSDHALLDAALTALVPACRELDVEVLVVRPGPATELLALGRQYPAVRFVPADAGMTLAELKRLGATQTSADIVTLTEELAASKENWSEVLIRRSCLFTNGSRTGDGEVDWAAALNARGVTEPERGR
ncbi:MAG: hypothetical protein ABJD11_02875 [Gemmatimonadota bacterium]